MGCSPAGEGAERRPRGSTEGARSPPAPACTATRSWGSCLQSTGGARICHPVTASPGRGAPAGMRPTPLAALALLLTAHAALASQPFALELRGGASILSGPESFRVYSLCDNDSLPPLIAPNG